MRVRWVPRGAIALALVIASPAGADTKACLENPLAKSCASDGAAPSKPRREPTASATGELFHTAPTKVTRAQLSQFLVAPAKRAEKVRAWARAIPLYQALVVARGPASPEARQLATLWTLAGQHTAAAEAWVSYGAATSSAAEREAATAESTRLAAAPDPFADKLQLTASTAEAKLAFAAGRRAFAARQYGDALVNFTMGYALAPELPGFLRELGSTYDKLGAAAQKRELYRRYLVQRPFGANADVIRAELARDKDALGTLLVSSSLPCTELWVNRQKLTGKLPAKGVAVAPGHYKGLCFNPSYEIALFEYAVVEPGKPTLMTFRWAVVENRLERPYGRIALENPKAPGVMIDLGITSPEIGVAAPADGRRLRMILKDDSGTRTEERQVTIEAGQRLVVRW